MSSFASSTCLLLTTWPIPSNAASSCSSQPSTLLPLTRHLIRLLRWEDVQGRETKGHGSCIWAGKEASRGLRSARRGACTCICSSSWVSRRQEVGSLEIISRKGRRDGEGSSIIGSWRLRSELWVARRMRRKVESIFTFYCIKLIKYNYLFILSFYFILLYKVSILQQFVMGEKTVKTIR